jgi:hypothetical protein
MNKQWLFATLFLVGCSSPDSGPPPVITDAGADVQDAAPIQDAGPDTVDANVYRCVPEKPDNVCANLSNSYGVANDWLQYSLSCTDPNVANNPDWCMMWSIDPTVYSPQTWAYCCWNGPVPDY